MENLKIWPFYRIWVNFSTDEFNISSHSHKYHFNVSSGFKLILMSYKYSIQVYTNSFIHAQLETIFNIWIPYIKNYKT